jgi:hypothetical protein
MRILPALALGCALLLPARGAAQDATPARTYPPSHLAAARELMEVMHLQEVSATGVRVMLDAQIRSSPEMEPYRAAMNEWGTEIFSGDEAKTAFATLYASVLSEADIRGLIAFYRTPLGQRLAAAQVTLTTRGAEIGRDLAQSHQAELMARLQRIAPRQ